MILHYIGIFSMVFTGLNTAVLLISHHNKTVDYHMGPAGYLITVLGLSLLFTISIFLI